MKTFEIRDSIYFREVEQDGTLILVDIDSTDDYLVKLEGVAKDFFKYLHENKNNDIEALEKHLIAEKYSGLEKDSIQKDFDEFLKNLQKLNVLS